MAEISSVTTAKIELDSLFAGRYRVKELIGTGGMATVYRALDEKQKDNVIALKLLHREFSEDKTHVERFMREMQMLSQIESPNVVKTYDIGTTGGLIYFTMEYVPARSLEQLMASKSFTETEIASLLLQICAGLQEIHKLGVVHRDLKPANLLITENNQLKIADLGVAREKASRLTAPNQKLGSISYMAPEVWLGKELTSRTDLYSLGIILYELATGELPFEKEFPGEIMLLHVEKIAPHPKKKNSELPDWLDKLTMWLIEKNPQDRPQSCEEIVSFVRNHTEGNAAVESANNAEDTNAATITKLSTVSPQKREKTYVFKLTSTRLLEDADLSKTHGNLPRAKTVVITLPKKAALIFEIEPPSRDFIYFGVFFASLQVLDGVLTSFGTSEFGTSMEGNPFLRFMMEELGPTKTLLLVKVFAVIVVALLTYLAKHSKWVKDLIGVLSCIYLVAAIIPWIYLLSTRAVF